MKRAIGYLCILSMVAFYVGCEWETSGDSDTYDSSAGWVNFSGVYGSPDGGVIVADFSRPTGSSQTETRWSEQLETGINDLHQYGSPPLLGRTPIVPGSVSVVAGGFHFQDDGNGALSGSIANTGGTINYATGAWSIDLGALEIPAGTPITADYRYLEGGDTGSVVEPGNSGSPIYSFAVEQTGNKLRFVDSNGMEYNGQLGVVSSAGGDATGGTSGEVVASFEVSRAGVTITGSFQGNYTAPDLDTAGSAVTAGTLDSRYLSATWIEDGGQTAGIVGVTAERVQAGGSSGGGDSGWL